MEDSAHKQLRPGIAIAVTVPLALIAVAAIETVLLPGAVVSFGDRLGVFAIAVAAARELLWAPVLFQLWSGGVVAFAGRARWRPLMVGLLGIGAALISWHLYGLLVDYPPFRGYWPFIVTYAGLFLFIWWWSVTLAYPELATHDSVAIRLLSRAPGYLALVGFVAGYILNNTLFPDAYLGLHFCTLQAAYLLLHAGLASTAVRWRRLVAIPQGGQLALLLGMAAILVVVPLAAARASLDDARAGFRRFTILGQSLVLSEPAPFIAAEQDAIGADADGVARFTTHSGLPELLLRLDDYNILLVTVETFRYVDSSFAAGRAEVTPNLRRFAEDGSFWFTRAYAAAPYTMQSMASIFSMTYPSAAELVLGYNSWDGFVAPGTRSVAELLAEAGYATAWIGHNVGGFFTRLVGGLDQGFAAVDLAEADTIDGDVAIVDAAMVELDKQRQAGARAFTWVFLGSPHHDYLVHYEEMAADSEQDRYRQELRFADEQIGRLLDHLRARDALDDTIVIIHGDHGEEFREHGKIRHHNLYSEVTHVPLVVAIPGMAGRRIDAPTSLTYLFPWLLSRGSAPLANAARDRMREHLGPMLQMTGNAVVSEMLHRHHPRVSLVYPDYRVVYDLPSRYVEIFDLRVDSGEHHNLHARGSELSAMMEAYLTGYLRVAASLRRFEYGRLEVKQPPPR